MERIKPELEQLSEKLRGMLFRAVHCQDEFERNCFVKSITDRKIKSSVNDTLKTIIADVYKASEVISEFLNSQKGTDTPQIPDGFTNAKLSETGDQ